MDSVNKTLYIPLFVLHRYECFVIMESGKKRAGSAVENRKALRATIFVQGST